LERHFSSVQTYFQWRYPDPIDQRWSPATGIRALVPVRLKHALNSRQRLRRESMPGRQGAVAAFEHRVLPSGYLKVLPPGLRYGKPHAQIAVCRGARS
jgi:hypothetical protein